MSNWNPTIEKKCLQGNIRNAPFWVIIWRDVSVYLQTGRLSPAKRLTDRYDLQGEGYITNRDTQTALEDSICHILKFFSFDKCNMNNEIISKC